MTRELKVPGGIVLHTIWNHPIAAAAAGIITAIPCAALTSAVEGPVAGMVMGLIGVLVGAPMGAIIAHDAAA